MRPPIARTDLLLQRARYGLEIALLVGLACLGLAAHQPHRPGAGLLLLAGILLLAVGAAALFSLRGSRVALLRVPRRELREAPRWEG